VGFNFLNKLIKAFPLRWCLLVLFIWCIDMAEDNIVSPTNKDFVSPVSGDDSEQLALKNREEYINVGTLALFNSA